MEAFWKSVSKRKAVEIKQVLTATGISKDSEVLSCITHTLILISSLLVPTGQRKNDLIQALKMGYGSKTMIERVPDKQEKLNIVSIDMGIRNFSYTRLEIDKDATSCKPPIVKEWVKIDLMKWSSVETTNGFEPSQLAEIGNKVIDELILNPCFPVPDSILVEKQRNRSQSSKQVFEWTLRVGMMESMIHGILAAKRHDFKKFNIIDVSAMNPQKMTSYWLPQKALSDKSSKNARVLIVNEWLQRAVGIKGGEKKFILDPSFIVKADGGLGPQKSFAGKSRFINNVVTHTLEARWQDMYDTKKDREKADDLVDSLLSGLTWNQWERNRTLLKSKVGSSADQFFESANKITEEHYQELHNLHSIINN